MKKLIALFLALALLASLGMTTFAAEDADTEGAAAPADRAMAATVLWVMAGQPVVNFEPGFEDLDPEGTYMYAVRWAAAEGIIKGYNAKTFGPADPITREQFSVMLYRYAQRNGLGFTGMWYFPLTAADAGDISDWADEAMHWVVMHGAPESEDELLQPKAIVTRKELSQMVTAFITGDGAKTAAFHRVQLGTAPYSVLIPDIYALGETTEEVVHPEDVTAFFYNDYTGTEVFIYQFSKEGLPEQLMDYAALEAADYGAEAESAEINGIPVARYTARTSYRGTDDQVLVAIIDAGEDYVELALVSKGHSGNFEIHSVLNSLDKLAAPAEADLAEKLTGRWMLADKNGAPAATNEKNVFEYGVDGKAYFSISIRARQGTDSPWANHQEAEVELSGSTVTLTIRPREGLTITHALTVTGISDNEFTANHKFERTVDGEVMSAEEDLAHFVRVDADYSDDILGTWEGRCVSEGSVFDDGQEHRWEYHADGSYVYYVKDGDAWVPGTNTYNEYFVAGKLLCTRWVDNGVESREWWEITIDGDAMRWTALRADDNGQHSTAAFVMTRVAE